MSANWRRKHLLQARASAPIPRLPSHLLQTSLVEHTVPRTGDGRASKAVLLLLQNPTLTFSTATTKATTALKAAVAAPFFVPRFRHRRPLRLQPPLWIIWIGDLRILRSLPRSLPGLVDPLVVTQQPHPRLPRAISMAIPSSLQHRRSDFLVNLRSSPLLTIVALVPTLVRFLRSRHLRRPMLSLPSPPPLLPSQLLFPRAHRHRQTLLITLL